MAAAAPTLHSGCAKRLPIVLVLLLGLAWLVPTAAGGHMLYRCYNGANDHMTSELPNCEGYTTEYPLGCTSEAGTMIYRCHNSNGQHMTSISATCEGGDYVNEAPLGHLYAAMPPNGVPVYRCYQAPDHMLSTHPNCEGMGPAAKEALLGYLTRACGGTDANWPTFNSQSLLAASPWSKYFFNLYGELPSAGYPLDLSTFWCFYEDKMSAAGIKPPQSAGQCPSKGAPDGQRYDENNAYSSKDLTWLWHAPGSPVFPSIGFLSNAIVEVTHHKDPFGDEHFGMWFLYAKGSGVFLDIGTTQVFNDHQDAYNFFKTPQDNQKMCQAAAAAGYDTVQFIKHIDGVNYPCAAGMGVAFMNIEIVAVKLVGTYPCGQAQGTAPALRAGWKGDKPCKCDPNNPNTNCVFS